MYSLECSDTGNLVARMNYSRGPSLSPHEDNVDKVRRRWHRVHLLEVIDGHFERPSLTLLTMELLYDLRVIRMDAIKHNDPFLSGECRRSK